MLPETQPSSWQARLQSFLVYSGVTYALGFLTVLFHTARCGVQVIEVIKPLNFWIGAPPTLVLLLSLAILARLTRLSDKPTGEISKVESPQAPVGTLRREWRSFLGVSGFLLRLAFPGLGFFAAQGLSALVRDRIPGGGILAPIVFMVVFVCSVAASFTLLPALAVTLRRKLRGVTNVLVWLVLTAGTLWCYVAYVYPLIPQRYGGGKPSWVRLVVDPASVPANALGWISAESATNPSPRLTRDLELLFRSSDAYIIRCNECTIKVVSVSQEAVKAVVWREAH